MLLQYTLHAIERCRLLRIKGGAFAILQEKHMPGSSAGRCGHHANDLSMQPRMVCVGGHLDADRQAFEFESRTLNTK